MIEDFWDEKNGGFYSTPQNNVDLPVRPKELYDGAMPSANSVALFNLVALARLTADPKWENRSQDLIRAFAGTELGQQAARTTDPHLKTLAQIKAAMMIGCPC